MSYSIVEFTKDKTVAAVPTSWLISKNRCAWPKTKSEGVLNKCIERKSPYNEIDFNVFDARVLQTNIGI